MNKVSYISNSLEETMQIAESFMDTINSGCILSLVGDLGAGKTSFTKGVAKSLKIDDVISSPTFTLLKEYEGRLKLKHIDAYRLENAPSDALSLYDLIEDDSVIIIEWGNYIEDIVYDYIIEIDYIDDTSRKITIKGENV